MSMKIIDKLFLAAILVLIGTGAVASPQLEALKDNWAEEKQEKLPSTREEWEVWKEGDLESLKAMVEKADTMKPSLVTRFVESSEGYRGSGPIEYVVSNMLLRVKSSFDIIKGE